MTSMETLQQAATAKLCIFHANCLDGFAAAWVVRKFCKTNDIPVEFLPATYGDKPPSVIGRDVIIVDFSYPRADIEVMMALSTSLTLFDHHKTALDDLKGIREREQSNVVMDMNRSGAGLTWDMLFAGEPRPKLIDLVEDHDLWRNDGKGTLPFTRPVNACLFSHPYDFELWDRLVEAASTTEGLFILGMEGEAIERKHHKDVAEIVRMTLRTMQMKGWTVPVANAPKMFASDAGHLMCKTPDIQFAATYFDREDGKREFSLRSVGDFDVSAVAKLYGGGGHRNAAGFAMPTGWEGDEP